MFVLVEKYVEALTRCLEKTPNIEPKLWDNDNGFFISKYSYTMSTSN